MRQQFFHAFVAQHLPSAGHLRFVSSALRLHIGLERIGGITVWDVTHPDAPVFLSYINTRDFAGDLLVDRRVRPIARRELRKKTQRAIADTRAWLADRYLEKADKMSMAHGLESRVPFLDKAVVEFAFRLPIDDKVKLNLNRKGRSLKRLLGLVLEDLLPRAILDKPKHGFHRRAGQTAAIIIACKGLKSARGFGLFKSCTRHIASPDAFISIMWCFCQDLYHGHCSSDGRTARPGKAPVDAAALVDPAAHGLPQMAVHILPPGDELEAHAIVDHGEAA